MMPRMKNISLELKLFLFLEHFGNLAEYVQIFNALDVPKSAPKQTSWYGTCSN